MGTKTDRTGKRNKSTVIVEDINVLLSIIDGTARQKVSTDIEEPNTTISPQA